MAGRDLSRAAIDAAIRERMKLHDAADATAIASLDAILATAGIKAEDKAGGMVWRLLERTA